MATVSVVMITYNESEMLPHSLSRLEWADEIIVVDSHSSDDTRDIAVARGAKVFTREFKDFSEQSNWAMAQATGDWILIVDADEMITPELRDAIIRAIQANPSVDIFSVRFVSYVFGRRMRSSVWSSEWHPRLFRRGAVEYVGAVHQDPQIANRPIIKLDGQIIHYTYRSMAKYFEKFQLYSTLWAEKAYASGRRTNIPNALISMIWRVFHDYFIRGNIWDGMIGFICSILSGMHTFVRHMKLWGLYNKDRLRSIPTDEEDAVPRR